MNEKTVILIIFLLVLAGSGAGLLLLILSKAIRSRQRGRDNAVNWSAYHGYIFDVDGTLYAQSRVRWGMLWKLATYFCIRPHRIRELLAIYLFRKLREKPKHKNDSFADLFRIIESKTGLPANAASRTIQTWMFEAPLTLLKKYAYRDVVDYINRKHADGCRIIVYSDYPAEEKLKAIGIRYDAAYDSSHEDIMELKPSLKAMRKILSENDLAAEQLVYVGDRDDKDRASAALAHIRYFDISDFRRMIH